jgi:hypothetical protein
MYIYTKLRLDFEGNVIEQEGYEYNGPLAYCKGASKEEKAQAAQQADTSKKQAAFFDVMTASYNKMFEGQTAILGTLKKTFEPILKAGPNQYGLSAAEDRAIRTQASETTAQSYKMAKQAVAEGRAAQTGDAFIPKGSDAQLDMQLASSAAAQESQQQLGITQKGYDIGRQQFGAAASALSGVAQQMNPIGFSGQASTAGQTATQGSGEAFDQYKDIYDQNKAASGWNIAGGILGGAIQAGVSGFTGGYGTALGGRLGK